VSATTEKYYFVGIRTLMAVIGKSRCCAYGRGIEFLMNDRWVPFCTLAISPFHAAIASSKVQPNYPIGINASSFLNID
jgi:hypothetical protein